MEDPERPDDESHFSIDHGAGSNGFTIGGQSGGGGAVGSDHFTIDFTDDLGFRAPPLKVYLAGPMTHNDMFLAEESRKLRVIARDVLSEHFEVYDPAEVTPYGSPHAAEDVYRTDHLRVRESDMVFFNLNAPSHGVGIESQIAAEATIPALVAYIQGTPVSRMISGMFSITLEAIEYADVADFALRLRRSLPSVVAKVKEMAEKRRRICDLLRRAQIGKEVLRLRLLKGIPLHQLADQISVRPSWLHELECNDCSIESWSAAQLMQLTSALNLTLTLTGKTPPSSYGSDGELEPQLTKSLDNLVEFVRGEECRRRPSGSGVPILNEPKIFRLWKHYRESVDSGVVGRDPLDVPNSVEDWRRLYTEGGMF